MKFVEAMKFMLEGKKVKHPSFTISQYVYIKDDEIVNQHGYQVSIDVNSNNWILVEEDK